MSPARRSRAAVLVGCEDSKVRSCNGGLCCDVFRCDKCVKSACELPGDCQCEQRACFVNAAYDRCSVNCHYQAETASRTTRLFLPKSEDARLSSLDFGITGSSNGQSTSSTHHSPARSEVKHRKLGSIDARVSTGSILIIVPKGMADYISK